ncbi:hypothetical protein NE619_14770 [Anaerovorax odorimutans]|uniref:Uncharacterized protein n=1 Tax=Anaerovorax odorimutans TaxID=109327 RepID=A0ABT1RS45_9FIRM|nr:hypothetical protein [Anaerovorax odorimutans]MCQ4637997.1 hypothetical protein [Anaerovorax odorimutans]
MRSREEILREMEKVNKAKKAAVHKQLHCVNRLNELKNELKEAEEHETKNYSRRESGVPSHH